MDTYYSCPIVPVHGEQLLGGFYVRILNCLVLRVDAVWLVLRIHYYASDQMFSMHALNLGLYLCEWENTLPHFGRNKTQLCAESQMLYYVRVCVTISSRRQSKDYE